MGGPYGQKKIDVNTGVDTESQADAEKLQTILGILAQSNSTPLTTPTQEPTPVQEGGITVLTKLMGVQG